MAKRARGSVRPGQRRPSQRSARPAGAAPRPSPATSQATPVAPSAPSTGLTAEEEARAAELEAAIVAQEGAAPTPARSRSRSNDTPVPNRLRPQAGASLAARYAHEYDYVGRDLREIFLLMGILVAALIVIWIVLVFGLGV